MSTYLSKSIISNVGSTLKRPATKTVPSNVGSTFKRQAAKTVPSNADPTLRRYITKLVPSNEESTVIRPATKTVPSKVGIAFNKKSHKREAGSKKLNVVVQELTKVPNQTWVAYTLSNKNHAEKRAEIFRCQQETGTISRTIMQTLKRGDKVFGDEVNKFAIGIDFLVQNKKNVTSHMINTLADGVQQLTYQIYLCHKLLV